MAKCACAFPVSGKRIFFHLLCTQYVCVSLADLEDEEEMKQLEDEISELHKSNSALETEMSQLKAQISNMEDKMHQQERDNQVQQS